MAHHRKGKNRAGIPANREERVKEVSLERSTDVFQIVQVILVIMLAVVLLVFCKYIYPYLNHICARIDEISPSLRIVTVSLVASSVLFSVFYVWVTKKEKASREEMGIIRIPVGRDPRGMALTPDDTQLYVANHGDDTVSVIDVARHQVKKTIPVGKGPMQVMITPDGTQAYVPNEGDCTVSVIDTATFQIKKTFLLGASPHRVLFAGTRAEILDQRNTSIATIDTVKNRFIEVLPPPGGPNAVTLCNSHQVFTVHVGRDPQKPSFRPDSKQVYVPNYTDGTVSVIDLGKFPQGMSPQVKETIKVGRGPMSVTFTPDSRQAYVPNREDDTISVIDTAQCVVKATIPVGNSPCDVKLNQDGSRARVIDAEGHMITVIDTSTNEVVYRNIPISSGAASVA
jgi:YVTN family beta-propeller protein